MDSSFSVVVTARDGAEAVKKLLTELTQQTLLPAEVVLTFTEDSQEALEFVRSWKKHAPFSVQAFSVGKATRSAGRNIGVEHATQKIVVFTDVGCRPDKDWLKNLIAPFSDPQVSLVSGLTLGEIGSTWNEAQSAFVLVSEKKIPQHPLPATRNMAVKRSVFQKSGGFLPELNFAEDYEWSRRMEKNGVRAVFAPKARVFWLPRHSSLGFWKMVFLLTCGDMQSRQWRLGHLTMWLRYAAFASLFLILSRYLSFPTNFLLTGELYLLYLFLKARSFHFQLPLSYLWAVWFQVLADTAVLSGTVLGLAWRGKTRDNTIHA